MATTPRRVGQERDELARQKPLPAPYQHCAEQVSHGRYYGKIHVSISLREMSPSNFFKDGVVAVGNETPRGCFMIQ